MAAINRFEEIEAWRDARKLVKQIYQACQNDRLSRDFGLRDQMQRAAVSIMANIAEGHGRRGDQEFIQYLKVARGSCSETLSHAYVAKDLQMIPETEFEELQNQLNMIGKKLSGLINYLRNQTSRK